MSESSSPSRNASIIFSLMIPGTGHIHAGRTGRGVALHVLYQIGLLSCIATLWSSPRMLFAGIAVMLVSSRAFAVYDVLRLLATSERRAPWGLVFAVGAALFMAGQAGLRWIFSHVVDTAAMTSTRMVPTLRWGDAFFVDRRATLEPGDVVVAEAEGGLRVVGRMVAGPGQRVEVRAGGVVVDDKPIPRCEVGVVELSPGRRRVWLERIGSRLHLTAEPEDAASDHPPTTVSEGSVFLLGDHRDGAIPLGETPRGAIVGPVATVIWGADGERDADVSGRDGVAIPPLVEPLRGRLDACRDELMGAE
ncbi:MAG: S26 family signal peptidase [Myxococcota bacterium]